MEWCNILPQLLNKFSFTIKEFNERVVFLMHPRNQIQIKNKYKGIKKHYWGLERKKKKKKNLK